MPPVAHSRAVGGGDCTPMNNTNTSFSFQIPGTILKGNENLLADDSDEFFLGGASADIDMSAGSPLKLRGNDLTQTTMATNTTTRRVTRSQSRSPQKPQTKTQPPRSAKRPGAVGMTASSSGLSFPASMYQGERLMEVEEMDGMDGMDSIDVTYGVNGIDKIHADDAKALPVLEPIAAELNKPRSSSRRSKSPSKSKATAKERKKERLASNTTTTTNLTAMEFESPAMGSMSAYLPPLSPDVSASTKADMLHPNAFNFGFSPQTTSQTEIPARERDQGQEDLESAGTTTTTTTGHAERKIPLSRIERREKRVTSRSKTTNSTGHPTTTTTETEADTGIVADAPGNETSSSVAPPQPQEGPSEPERGLQLQPLQGDTEVQIEIHPPRKANLSTFGVPQTDRSNPFEALKKRVTSPDYVLGSAATAEARNGVGTVRPKRDHTDAGLGVDVTVQDGAPAPLKPTTATTMMTRGTQPEPGVPDINSKTKLVRTASMAEIQPTLGLDEPKTTATMSRVSMPPAPAPSTSTAVSTVAGHGAKPSAFGTLKAGLGLADKTSTKTTAKDKPSTSSGDVNNTRPHTRADINTKKRPSSEAVSGSGSRAMPGAYETEMADGASSGDGTSAADDVQAPPPRKRARRDSVMLGMAAANGSSSSSLLRRRGSLLPSTSVGVPAAPHGHTTTTTTAVPPAATSTVARVNPPVPMIVEEPEPELVVGPAVAPTPALEVMGVEVETEARPDPVVGDVDMHPPSPGPGPVVPSPTEEQALDADLAGETAAAVPSAPLPLALPAAADPATGAVPPAEIARDSKALRKRRREEEAEAHRRRDEAKREVRREQQKMLRKSLAVIAAAAAATVVAAVAADAEDEDEEDEDREGGMDDEGGDGNEQGPDTEEREGRLSPPNFGATKPAEGRKAKVEPKGKARAKVGKEVSSNSKKHTRTTSITTTAKSRASRSTAASSSKATTVKTVPVQAQSKASRKIATNSRVNRSSKEGPSAPSTALAGPSSLPSSDKHTDTQTRSRSRTWQHVAPAEVQGGPGMEPSMRLASGASLDTSSASSESLKSRPPFQVPLPVTLHGGFAARADARREARRREKERDPGEKGEGDDGTSSAKTVMRSTSRTSTRNGNNGPVKEKPPIPDFAAMHAAQAALLERAKASLPPLTKPHGPALTTGARMKDRAVFDAHVKEKEAAEEKKREEERRRREEEEELEIKEMRRRAVPKAHEVPEWYRDMPKKTKTTADSGDQPSSSTS